MNAIVMFVCRRRTFETESINGMSRLTIGWSEVRVLRARRKQHVHTQSYAQESLWPDFTDGYDFPSVFAIFFSVATGVISPLNMVPQVRVGGDALCVLFDVV
jgi:hypothetical protein